jgi:hypothetical protein
LTLLQSLILVFLGLIQKWQKGIKNVHLVKLIATTGLCKGSLGSKQCSYPVKTKNS